ncbi:MAG TPA: hypothetical protein VMD28_09160 [Acidimicrobiales bacterium]|nr:hypothetical protein [Acidimicrobiales bacterium]
MPSDRTTVTELGTGLGMLGLPDVDDAVRSRTPVMHSISPEMWEHLSALRAGGAYDTEFHAAWANGQAFLAAADGLRGRLPTLVEWKGTGKAPGDEVAPIDLRVDHVYLVSCKYLSNILFNASPWHVFDYLLIGGQSRASRAARDVLGGGDWYTEVAPEEHQALYEAVRRSLLLGVDGSPEGTGSQMGGPGPVTRSPVQRGAGRGAAALSLPGFGPLDETGAVGGASATDGAGDTDAVRTRRETGGNRPAPAPASLRSLPARAVDLTTTQRDLLGQWLRAGWPDDAKDRYVALSDEVARASARRWEDAIAAVGGAEEAMVWRLLRIGSAPYFVLGSSPARSLRLRIATSWDWRQQFKLASFSVEAQPGGQPRVGWEAVVRHRVSHELYEVTGHIEVRWSHGRFGGLPEAKGYLDVPHHVVPGYFSLR